MARKISFYIDFPGADILIKQLSDSELELRRVGKAISSVTKDLDTFRNGTAKQITALQSQGKSIGSLTDLYNTLRTTETDLLRQQGLITDEIREQSRAFDLLERNIPTDSLTGLREKYRKLRQEIDLMSESARNSVRGLSLIREASDIQSNVNRITASVGDFRSQIGNYRDALSSLFSGGRGLRDFSLSVTDIVTGNLLSGGIKELAQKAIEGAKIVYQLNAAVSELKADIQKTSGLTDDEVNNLSDSLEKLDTRTSLDQLLEIAVIGGRLGITGAEGLEKFTGAVSKLDIALGDEFSGGIQEVTDRTGKLSNVLFGATKDGELMANRMLGLGNALNVLAANGQATAGTITDMASRISALLVPIGATQGQILGLSAAMDNLAINPERGGSAMVRIIQRIGENLPLISRGLEIPQKQLTELFNADPVKAFQLVAEQVFEKTAGVPDKLIRKLDELKLRGVGNTEVFLKLGQNAGLVQENIDLATEALTNYNSIQNEVDRKNETVTGQFERFGNKIKEAFTDKDFEEFFKALIAVVDELFNVFVPIGQAISEFVIYMTGGTSITQIFTGTLLLLKAGLELIANVLTGVVIALRAFGEDLKESLIKDAPGLVKGLQFLRDGFIYVYDAIIAIPQALAGVGAVIGKFFDDLNNGGLEQNWVSPTFNKAVREYRKNSEELAKSRELDLIREKELADEAALAEAERLEAKLDAEEKNTEAARNKRARAAAKKKAEEEREFKESIKALQEYWNTIREIEISELNKRELTKEQYKSRLETINNAADIQVLRESLALFEAGSSEYLKILNQIDAKAKDLQDNDITIKLADIDSAIKDAEYMAASVAVIASQSEEELQTRLKNIKDRADVTYIRQRLELEKLSAEERFKLEEELRKKTKDLDLSQAKIDIDFDNRDKGITDQLNTDLNDLDDATTLDNLEQFEKLKTDIIIGAELERLELKHELLTAAGQDTLELEREINDKLIKLNVKRAKEEEKVLKDLNKVNKKRTEELYDVYRDAFGQIGTALGEFLGSSEKDSEEFNKRLFKTLLDALEKIVLISTVSASAQSFAQPDSVATFGASGTIRAAILTALIKGAFAAIKASILEDGGIIQPENRLSAGKILSGKRHHSGGIQARLRTNNGYKPYELEDGEGVMNRISTSRWLGLFSAMNEDGGGRQLSSDSYKYKPLLDAMKGAKLEAGGITTATAGAASVNTGYNGLVLSTNTSRISREDIEYMAYIIAKKQSEVIEPAFNSIPEKVADGMDNIARRKERNRKAIESSTL
jgi:TP901 family phage tail tape measure protein